MPEGGDKIAVTMAKDLLEVFGLERIVPAPARWEAGGASMRLEFPVVAGAKHAVIRFSGTPKFRGNVDLWTRLDKGETVSWSQFSVP